MNSDNAQSIARRYETITIRSGQLDGVRSQMMNTNPDMEVFVYLKGTRLVTLKPASFPSSWFLRDANGNLVVDSKNSGGRAYVMQLLIVGQEESVRILAEEGLRARVVDFSFFPFGPLFIANKEQIERVEQLSDAYHLAVGGDDIMVAYLLELRLSEQGARA